MVKNTQAGIIVNFNNDLLNTYASMIIQNMPKLKVVSATKNIATIDSNHLISLNNIHNYTGSPRIVIDGALKFKDDMYPVYTNANFCPYKLSIEMDSSNRKYLKIYWFADGNKYENKILLS